MVELQRQVVQPSAHYLQTYSSESKYVESVQERQIVELLQVLQPIGHYKQSDPS